MQETNRMLDRIDSPKDLRKLNADQLNELAADMREEIIQTVSKTGGHLASNLGVVELAISLHTVFESPKDKIIWDVSHQSYPHKLLTGRRDRFSTLRQDGGLCGFVRPDESEHDPFAAGHASTSISAALGLAKARDINGTNESVIAVIGDGALTGGLAFEGLNNASDLDTDVIIVLNDNEMSISENVTALSFHLARLRMDPIYQRVESRAKSTLERSPLGKRLARTAEGLSHGVTHLFGAKNGIIFEEFGFRYLGPIDGHNISLLNEVFESAKRMHGPVLVHVLTTKGKGYEHAEANARKFHGISGFTIADGNIEKSEGNTSFTQVFGETLVELAEKDSSVVAITAAMPDGTGLAPFAKEYPERFFDVGIAEEHAVTFAAGMAAGGLKPVVAIYSTFMQRSYDQMIHDVCLQNLPVVFCLDRAGIVGEDGPTHHGVFDLSFLRHIPNLVVMSPRDTNELRDMLATALALNGPVAIRYPRGGGPTVYEKKTPRVLPVGHSEVLRSGDDIGIISAGTASFTALAAAEELKNDGISAEVIDVRFIKPLDESLILGAAKRFGKLVVVEENTVVGGLGSAVLELLSKRSMACSVKQVGLPDIFLGYGSPSRLRDSVGLSTEGIANAVKSLMQSKA